MIAECKSIAHGAAMTEYCTRNNRARIVLTGNLTEGLPPLGMWNEMQVIQAKYAQRFRTKPVQKSVLRFEVSPSRDESRDWTADDWTKLAARFLDELAKASQGKGKDGRKKRGIDLSRAQLFACVHQDSRSGIPHLHILVNRIDLDGHLIKDSFIGRNCVKAAHAINVAEGWELPEDIRDANVREITDACYKVLSEMRSYSWNEYANRIKALGYDVKVQKDKQGVMHGYTVMKGNSRYKSSSLGKNRDLMQKNIGKTWDKLHSQSLVKDGGTARGMDISKPASKTSSKTSITPQSAKVQGTTEKTPVQSAVPRERRCFVKWDHNGKEEKTYVSEHIYHVISNNIEPYDDTPEALANCIKAAILLFAGYVDGATGIAESCGGGGSPESGWGRSRDEDDERWARRCAMEASWLCRPAIKRRR